MKKILIVFVTMTLACLSGGWAGAQPNMDKYGPNKDECIKYLSYYTEYYKQKNYDDATPHWRQAYHYCPVTCSENLLLNGTTLLRRLIVKNQRDKAYKEALVDSLLTLHDQRAEYYPKNAVTARNNKGVDMSNYIKTDYERLYQGYEDIIAANGEQTKTSLYLFDFKAAIELYKQGKLGAETIMELYQRNLAAVEAAKPETETEAKVVANMKQDIENLFLSSKVADCDNLIALFTPRYEADPDNLQLATTIVKMMSMTEGCADSDLYLKAVTTMYKIDPSYTSAYYLYRLHASKGNVQDAISYMNQAIDSEESDEKQDAAYLYELAVFCYKNGLSGKAFDAASKVPALDETLAGKTYLLIGNIWGASKCGGDEIARRAPYWVACDYMVKAKNADPTLAEEANRYISNYSRYFPETAEAFMYDITNGQSYTVVCNGMRAVTTVRTHN